MYTRTIEQTVYTYQDLLLNEDLKRKVLQKLWDINVDYEWWEFIFDDASNIGIKILEFDLDHHYIKALAPEHTATIKQNVIKNHGKNTDTYKTVMKYDLRKGEDEATDMVEELYKDYLIMLRREYEYLTSEEVIMETIEANEYEFDEDGNIS